MGFSDNISNPAFEIHRKYPNKRSYGFCLVLAAAAVVAVPLCGLWSRTVMWPFSLLCGIWAGAIILGIAYCIARKRDRDTTWDGVVIDKKTIRKQGRDHEDLLHIIYLMTVKRDDGKVYRHRYQEDVLFHYYEIGDRVRHHKCFPVYEKYDKAKDDCIFCIACGGINDINGTDCTRCRCPLLNG
ncbi:MAG: hypothetical protein R6W96_01265 [Clostridia bacterium]